jgi:serine/threonine protein kinase
MAQPSIKSPASSSRPAPHGRVVGRYLMFSEIGSGGTATVHFGRSRGPAGSARTVALKRLHPHLANDPFFASLFVSEARLTAHVHHRNVVPLLDLVRLDDGEVVLVMDYVHGETLGGLLNTARRRGKPIPPAVAVAIVCGALHGLHAAHEAVGDSAESLHLVHGDVSPLNIIVGADGQARVLDFGVAPSRGPIPREPRMIGTLAYMAPERLKGSRFDRRSDLFSAGVILWELLALERLFRGPATRDLQARPAVIAPPSHYQRDIWPALDAAVMRALESREDNRYATAAAFAATLERVCPPASAQQVAAWVNELAGPQLRERAVELARIEAISSVFEAEPDGAETSVVPESYDDEDQGGTVAEAPTVIDTEVLARLRVEVAASAPPPIPPAAPTVAAAPLRVVTPPASRAEPAQPQRPNPPAGGSATPSYAAVSVSAPRRERRLVDDGDTPMPTRIFERPATVPARPQRPAQKTEKMKSYRPPERSEWSETPRSRTRSPWREPGVAWLAGAAGIGAVIALLLGGHRSAAPTPPAVVAAVTAPAPELVPAVAPVAVAPAAATTPAVATVAAPPVAPAPVAATAAPVVARAEPVAARAEPAAPAPVVARSEPAVPAPVAVVAPMVARAPATATVEIPAVKVATLAGRPSPAQEGTATTGDDDDNAVGARSDDRHDDALRGRRGRRSALQTARAKVVSLNRRAMAAYERLAPDAALRLLNEAEQLLQPMGASGRDVAVTTHLNMGVVLAGGFKQTGLASRHFRLARAMRPRARPRADLISPDVAAALPASVVRPL